MMQNRKIAVVGLGYVGLPIAVAFGAGGFSVIAYDFNPVRIAELKASCDRTGEVSSDEIKRACLLYTDDPELLVDANFFIVAVPTPVDRANRPDLTALLAASRAVGGALKLGDIVVYESTVYPGATEEDCIPVLEGVSGLKAGTEFTVGYSPERINPGDREHRFESITKVVSGQDTKTLEIIAAIYGSVVKAGVHRAPNIKTAEAAKVIENAQRDLNIAFVNELSLIFRRLGINTQDVLAAAATKWNFLTFKPGLVGGHCIGVDPYYLTHKAEQAGYHSEVILAGRRVNDGMGSYVASEAIRLLMANGGTRNPVITILGVTFKEDVPDVRNSKVADIICELARFGVTVQVADPNADEKEVMRAHGVTLIAHEALKVADGIVLAVAHTSYRHAGWSLIQSLLKEGKGFVLDLKATLDRDQRPDAITLWQL